MAKFSKEEKEELQQIIRDTFLSLPDEHSPFWIAREQHYKQHLFLEKLETWTGTISSTFWKSIIKGVIKIIIIIILLGFGIWGAEQIGFIK